MKRRDFIKSAGVAAVGGAAASTLAAPAIAQERIEMVMVSTWPRDFPGLGTGAQRLAQRIQDVSDGRIQVQYFAAGERVGAFDVFDEVASGNAQAYHAADYYWKGKHPGWAYFTSVPFGLTENEMGAWIHFMGGQELWDELAAEFGLKCLASGNTGVQMGGWFNKEINQLEDYKGLKIRMPGLGGEVLRQIGAAAVSLPGGEIFPSLQSGAIDATEWVGPWNDLAFGFYKVTKYYYYPGFHEPGTALGSGINLKVWESLSNEHQAIITDAMAAENNATLAEFNARNNDALDTLTDKHKVILRKFDEKTLNAIGEASGDVVSATASEGGITKEVYDSFIKFRKKAIAWSKISDQAYWNARILPFKYGE